MGHGKSSGFSSGGMTVSQLAERYADGLPVMGVSDDPLAPSNLPAFIQDKMSSEVLDINAGGSVVRETEKAVLVSYSTSYGSSEVWVPKSVIKSSDEVGEHARRRQVNAFINNRYSVYLRETAEANGVKVGNMSGWDKMKAKMDQAGVKYMDKETFSNSKQTAQHGGIFETSIANRNARKSAAKKAADNQSRQARIKSGVFDLKAEQDAVWAAANKKAANAKASMRPFILSGAAKKAKQLEKQWKRNPS